MSNSDDRRFSYINFRSDIRNKNSLAYYSCISGPFFIMKNTFVSYITYETAVSLQITVYISYLFLWGWRFGSPTG